MPAVQVDALALVDDHAGRLAARELRHERREQGPHLRLVPTSTDQHAQRHRCLLTTIDLLLGVVSHSGPTPARTYRM